MTPDLASVAHAARLLEQGKLVAIPTETVYGLAADADNPEAVANIFSAKGRPSTHPVIVHVARDADLSHWAVDIPPQAAYLIQAFWPGPLTLILKRAPKVSDSVTGGQDSVGLRCPSHPVAQALLKNFRGGQGGIAAPSANRFGRVSPTTAQHVIDEFGEPGIGPVAAVLDGGPCTVGIESTIVDLTRLDTHGPVLLRPGQISAQAIETVLGCALAQPDQAAPRVSGSLDAHYAPQTPLVLIASESVASTTAALQAKQRQVACLRITTDPHTCARDLYAQLRKLDQLGADVILVEQPPSHAEWQGINDRLRRAAFDSTGVLQRLLA
ncbi:MAG: threonylcarbamoyl-AMP synthase [Betaproteobacteria bacterium]|nr:threonylcarbamoyl-AMP synthase [Betaproteobacteria bacterium]